MANHIKQMTHKLFLALDIKGIRRELRVKVQCVYTRQALAERKDVLEKPGLKECPLTTTNYSLMWSGLHICTSQNHSVVSP